MMLEQYIRHGVQMVADEKSQDEVGWWFARRYLRRGRIYGPRNLFLHDKHILMDLNKMGDYQVQPPYVPLPGAAAALGDFSPCAYVNPATFFSDKVELNEVNWGDKEEHQEAHEPVYEIDSFSDGPRKLMPPCAACTPSRTCAVCIMSII